MSNNIEIIKDNQDKKLTYKILNAKLKKSYNTDNFHEVINLSYAMIEDRLLTFLDLLFIIQKDNKKIYPTHIIDEIIRPILKYDLNAEVSKIYKINNLSTKLKIIKKIIQSNSNSNYILDCKRIIEKNIGIDNLLLWIKKVEFFSRARNEIVHASFNKNIIALKDILEKTAKESYILSLTIKKYVNLIKDNHLQISVKTKWKSIDRIIKNEKLNISEDVKKEVFDENYDEYFVIGKFDILKPTLMVEDSEEPDSHLDYYFEIISSFYTKSDSEFSTRLSFIFNMKDKLLKTKNIFEDFKYLYIRRHQRGYDENDFFEIGKVLFNKNKDELDKEFKEYAEDFLIRKKYKEDLALRFVNDEVYNIYKYDISDELKHNKDFIKSIVLDSPEIYIYDLTIDEQNDRDILLNYLNNVSNKVELPSSLNEKYFNDKNIVLKFINRNCTDIYNKIAPELQNDLDILELIFKKAPELINTTIWNKNKEFIENMQIDNINYANDILECKINDENISDFSILMFSENIRNEKNFMLKCLEYFPINYEYISDRFKKDIDFIVFALNHRYINCKTTFNIINEEHLNDCNVIEKICNIDDEIFIELFLYGLSDDLLKKILVYEKILNKLVYGCNEILWMEDYSDEIIQKIFQIYDGVPNNIDIIKSLFKISPYYFLLGGKETKEQDMYENTLFEKIDNNLWCQCCIKDILSNKEEIKEVVKYHSWIMSHIDEELKEDIQFIVEIVKISCSSYDYLLDAMKENDVIKKVYEEKKNEINKKYDWFLDDLDDFDDIL